MYIYIYTHYIYIYIYIYIHVMIYYNISSPGSRTPAGHKLSAPAWTGPRCSSRTGRRRSARPGRRGTARSAAGPAAAPSCYAEATAASTPARASADWRWSAWASPRSLGRPARRTGTATCPWRGGCPTPSASLTAARSIIL